jgi:DNA-directed RNA polymerase subunit beta
MQMVMGIVEYVDATEIHVRYDRTENEKLVSFEDDVKVYKLTKFAKTNQATCINLRPIVKKGQKVIKGQILMRRLCNTKWRISFR